MNIEERLHELGWQVELSIRYHSRRYGFFSTWHTFSMVVVVLAGSASLVAVFSAIGGKADAGLWALVPPMVVTTFALLDVLIGFADRANRHWVLRSRFAEAERKLIEARCNPTDEVLTDIEKLVSFIEIDEPKVLHVLSTVCHNEMIRARDYPRDQMVDVKLRHRLFKNIWDLGEYNLMQAKP